MVRLGSLTYCALCPKQLDSTHKILVIRALCESNLIRIQSWQTRSIVSVAKADCAIIDLSVPLGRHLESIDLQQAVLVNASFRSCLFNNTNFTESNLSNTITIETDIMNSIITFEQLCQAKTLINTFLPNGTFLT